MLRGVVQDSTGAPIPYAQVTLRRAGLRLTDDSGRFQFSLRDIDEIEMEVRRIGFRMVEYELSEIPERGLVVVLFPIAHSLPAVHAEAEKVSRSLELHGFYRRLADRERGIGSGIFITPEEIADRRPTRASHILDGVPGVRLVRTSGSGNRSGIFGNNMCPMTVYLDRIRLNSLGVGAQTPPDIDEVLTPGAVAGVEVYTRRSSLPSDFAMLNGTCGVVIIWTR